MLGIVGGAIWHTEEGQTIRTYMGNNKFCIEVGTYTDRFVPGDTVVVLPPSFSVVDTDALAAHNAEMKELKERIDSREATRLWDAVCRVYVNPDEFLETMVAEAAAMEGRTVSHE